MTSPLITTVVYRAGSHDFFIEQDKLLCKAPLDQMDGGGKEVEVVLPPSLSCCVREDGRQCNFQVVSEGKRKDLNAKFKDALAVFTRAVRKKLKDTAPVGYQCSPSDKVKYLPATAVPKMDLRYFKELVQQCPDVRITVQDPDIKSVLGLNLPTSEIPIVRFLNIPNSPNMADVILSAATTTFVVIDDPNQGTWNSSSSAEEITHDTFNSVHGGCGAHLGGRP